MPSCGRVNSSKGSEGPSDFLRRSRDGRGLEYEIVRFCEYVQKYYAVKVKYGLSLVSNDKKVFGWLCVLGSILTLVRVGDVTYIRDLGLDPSVYVNSELILWVIFLFIFQYYFKNHSNYCWPKPILEKKSDEAVTKSKGDPWTD